MATAALAVALASLALAVGGGLALGLGMGSAVTALAALEVAMGGGILAVTLAAIGLLVTRDPADRDPRGRRRAWLGGGAGLALLVLLVALFQAGLAGPVRVDAAGAATGAPGLAAEALPDARAGTVPVPVDRPVAVAFERAHRAAEALGWRILATDRGAGRIRAVPPEGGEVTIRVRQAPRGSLVELHTEGGAADAGAGWVRAFVDRVTRS